MNKYIFGITGPTGAGKTTVSRKFTELGVQVIDCDAAARYVTDNIRACINELYTSFGPEVFNDDGTLNRHNLANIVFTNDDKLKLLNEITHKYIKMQIETEIQSSNSDIIAIDGAVIIGSPVMELCDKLIVVTADEDVRAKRIVSRDNISYDLAYKRISSQMSCTEYESYADFIINNNDNVGLGENIEKVYSKIKNFSEAKRKKNS